MSKLIARSLSKMERTLVIIKPDGLAKGLNEEYIEAVAKQIGASSIKSKRLYCTLNQSEKHYEEHRDTERFDRITKGLCDGEMCATILQGENVIKLFREAMRSIRTAFSTFGSPHLNAVHGSDSVESAEREIELWF